MHPVCILITKGRDIMFLSFEQAKIRLRYLEKRLEKLPKGKVTERVEHGKKRELVWIRTYPYAPSYNRRYYYTTKEPGISLMTKVVESSRIETEIQEIIERLRTSRDEVRCVSRIKRRNEPVTMNRKFFDELKKTEDSNPYPKTNPVEYNGILFRSKGEMLIAQKLDELGLEYSYESRLNIGRDVYPDFSVYISEIDKVFFIEFMGGFGNSEYNMSSGNKFSDYANYGYINGRDIIFICETDVNKADVELLEAQINALIMANTEVRKKTS